MNIYKQLNALTEYIEDNLENDLRPEILTKFLNTNLYTAGKLFTVFTGQTFSDYVRKRRLSLAGYDLYSTDLRVIDVALKYGYENATAFSRAFEKFHGIKPSAVTKNTKLKNFPRVIFDEKIETTTALDYEIIKLPKLTLFGLGKETNNSKINRDAPNFFREMSEKYRDKYGRIDYGMITYDETHSRSQKYYCLFERPISEFEKIIIPAGKWLKFPINSQNAPDIQKTSRKFYREFLPSSKYALRPLPELEYYHDDKTDFLVAIE